MKLLHRSSVCALALVAGTAAMQFEPAILRDLVVDTGAQQISVGAVRTSLWSSAFAQAADTFSVENVRFTWGPFSYEAKRIDFTGVSLARSEIESLLSSSSEPFAERLARINARQVSVPELKVVHKLGNETQTIFYRNGTLSDIVLGKVGSLAIETTAIEETGGKGPTLMSYGRTSIRDLDLPAFARLYETKDTSAPLSKLHGEFSIEKIDVTDSAEGFNAQIARIGGRDIMARPTKDSWNGTIALIKELSEKEQTSPEEDTRLLLSAADILGAFDAGFVEATGITLKGNGQDNKESGSIARIAYTGATGSEAAEARVEGIEFADADSRLKIGAISLKGFSVTPTLNGLKALGDKPLKDLDSADVRSLIPTLGTLRITDMDIEAPASDDKPDELMRVAIGLMELTADKPVNGIPTNIRFEQRNLSTTLPDNSTDELAQQLQALGYKSIDGSFVAAATWNEATNEIAIKEFSMDGKDMGSVRLTGIIGNVSPDLFSADEATASAAMIGAKAKAANIVVENKGLVERYLESAAKDAGTTPDSLQKLYAGATPLVLSGMIGNSEQSRTLGKAISRFIENPGKLTINAQPKNPSGFGVMDAMLASDPKAMLEKLNITATAE
ncbi:hypothetical protein [Microvirga guangxiensis]|uniref:AsmA protein n=1 Tax=Microvirga guangxiensis TaxID=549386 RepID=A0A1G5B455_9HYPH|nr:hypothetical protein [Microvirga guangxiensis]SCX84913.1 hypothetical protein SAMN02927923_00117 [Microvirga guangxiensis]